MENDSIETLLLRHYGNTAQTPTHLEDKLLASVRLEAKELRKAHLAATRLQQKRLSRRQATRLMFRGAGNAGMGILSASLEGLQKLETVLISQDATTAYP